MHRHKVKVGPGERRGYPLDGELPTWLGAALCDSFTPMNHLQQRTKEKRRDFEEPLRFSLTFKKIFMIGFPTAFQTNPAPPGEVPPDH